MPATKFTPGPWAHVVKMDGFTAVGARTLIARVFSEALRDHENEAANARLIAAAPDLHAALTDLLKASGPAFSREDGFFIAAREKALSVLAKAEGKS